MAKTGSGTNIGWDDSDRTITKQFDWCETVPSVAVVRLLSVAMNCEPTAIEPLAESVDPDALDRLLPSMDEGSNVQFSHLCLSVSLYGDGTVTVEPAGR